MHKIEMLAKNISCNHCKMTIANGITSVAGVASVQVEIGSKKVTVVFDESQATAETLLVQMEKLGYPAEVIVG